MRLAISNADCKFRRLALQARILLGAQSCGGSNNAGISDIHLLDVILRQFVLLLQVVVDAGTDSTVGTIGSNKDITLVCLTVGTTNQSMGFGLFDRSDLRVVVDPVGGDLGEKKTVELGTTEQNIAISDPIHKHVQKMKIKHLGQLAKMKEH